MGARAVAIGAVAVVCAAIVPDAPFPTSAVASLGPPHFVEETPSAGIGHTYDGGFEFAAGGGVAAFDCNLDGKPDLYLDETDWLQGDKVYSFKKDLLEKHGIVVWRFHDYWHSFRPDGILMGVLVAMGWDKYYYIPAYDSFKWGLLDWNNNINPLASAIKCAC